MKSIVFLLATLSLFGTAQVFAQSPASCGKSGEIIEVHESKSSKGIIKEIPLECRQGREENWFGAPPEAGMTKEEICQKTMNPYDEYTGRDMVGMKNMSACFCMVDQQFSSGKMTKCWTYFDRDRR
ncbi:MAG: hypothetical protein WC680_03035 [Sulfuricurvum sp.]|jgi:hypothetical protein